MLKEAKYIGCPEISVGAKGGSTIFEALMESLKTAATHHCIVNLKHNERVYKVDPHHYLNDIYKRYGPDAEE